jgi:hypothetical protein
MLSKEKQDLVRKLLNEKHPAREIRKIAQCSPNEITPMRNRMNDENKEGNKNIKSKSTTSQALDLFQKGVHLIQVIIDLDTAPELGKKYQEIHLDLSKREKIVSLLKDGKDLPVKIKILEFLQENHLFFTKIKQAMDIQIVIWKLIAERYEEEGYLKNTKFLYNRAEARLQGLIQKLNLMEKKIKENNYL